MASKNKNIQIVVTSKGLKEVKRDLVSIRKLTGPGKSNNIKVNLSVNQKAFQQSVQKAFNSIASKKINLSVNQAHLTKSLTNALRAIEKRGLRLNASVAGAKQRTNSRAERIAGGSGTSNIIGGVAFQKQSLIATKESTKAQLKGNSIARKNVSANKAIADSGRAMAEQLRLTRELDKVTNTELINLNRSISLLNKSVIKQLKSSLHQERRSTSNPEDLKHIQKQLLDTKELDRTRKELARLTPSAPIKTALMHKKDSDLTPLQIKQKANDRFRYDTDKRIVEARLRNKKFVKLEDGRVLEIKRAIELSHQHRNSSHRRHQKWERAVDRVTKATNARADQVSNTRAGIGGGIGRGTRGGGTGGGGTSGGSTSYKQNRGIIGTKGGGGDFSHMASGMGGFVGVYAEIAAKTFALGAAFRALKEAADFGVLIKGMTAYQNVTGSALLSITSDIQKITQGTVEFKQAAQGVTMATAAGFDPEQIRAMGTAATNAGMALGRDLGDAYDRVIKGVTKAEPELLDELGIILRLETASKKYAKRLNEQDSTLNKSAKNLTTYEKQQAVLAEVLEQADKKFGKLGNTMEGHANSVTKLGTALSDLALKTADKALDVDVFFGVGSIKDLMAGLAESASAVITALAALAAFLVTGLMPKTGKFTTDFQNQATKFSDSAISMQSSMAKGGGSIKAWAQEFDGLNKSTGKQTDWLEGFQDTVESISTGMENPGKSVQSVFENMKNSYEAFDTAVKDGDPFDTEFENLEKVVGPKLSKTLKGLTKTAADTSEGVSAIGKSMSASLFEAVDGEVSKLDAAGETVGNLVNKELGINAKMGIRDLKDLRLQMLKTLDPAQYAKEMDKLVDSTSSAMSRGIRRGETFLLNQAVLSAKKKSLKAQGMGAIQQKRIEEGLASSFEEATAQAKKYKSEVGKVLDDMEEKAESRNKKETKRFLKTRKSARGLIRTMRNVGASITAANMKYGTFVAAFGRGMLNMTMKAVQFVAIYQMVESMVKGLAKAFGYTTNYVTDATSAAESFGEELVNQETKWIGYKNQLSLFTDGIEGFTQGMSHSSSTLESFGDSLDTMSTKYAMAYSNMTEGDKAGEWWSDLVFWQDSLEEQLEKQTAGIKKAIQNSGYLKELVASTKGIDVDNLTIINSDGKRSEGLVRLQRQLKKSTEASKKYQDSLKELMKGYESVGKAAEEFDKSILTSTKFDTLVDEASRLKTSFFNAFEDPKGVEMFEENLQTAIRAAKTARNTLDGISLSPKSVLGGWTEDEITSFNMSKDIESAMLKASKDMSSKLGIATNAADTQQAIREGKTAKGHFNKEIQIQAAGSALSTILEGYRGDFLAHLSDEKWEELSETIFNKVNTGLRTLKVKDKSLKASVHGGLGHKLVSGVDPKQVSKVLQDTVNSQITDSMIATGFYQKAISSQVEGMREVHVSAIETLIGEDRGYLEGLADNIKDRKGFLEATDILNEGIKKYLNYVKEAQRQSRYLQGEITLAAEASKKLVSTGTSSDLAASLTTENKVIDLKKKQIQLVITQLRLSDKTKEQQEAIAQEQKKLLNLEESKLSSIQILHQAITAEVKLQHGFYAESVGLVSQLSSALESIGSMTKSQSALLTFTTKKQLAINTAIDAWLSLEAKYQKDLKNTDNKDKLTRDYNARRQIVGDTLTTAVKLAEIEVDYSYLEHKLDIYGKLADQASAFKEISSELLGIQTTNNSVTESISILRKRDLDVSKLYLENQRELTELRERNALAKQHGISEETERLHRSEKAHLAKVYKAKQNILKLEAQAALNNLRETSYLDSINRNLLAEEELNSAKLTSSIHINNVKAREVRLENIKKKFDVKALQHEHNVLKIKEKLLSENLTAWDQQNLLRDISSEILEMEKEKVEVMEEYVVGLKEAHEAKKRIGEATLDDELYYRIQEMKDAMPSTIDSAANVMLGSINSAIDSMASNIKEGEGPYGKGGFEDFAAEQWRTAGDSLIDSGAEKLKVASASLMLGSGYVTPEERAVEALKKQEVNNHFLFDIIKVLEDIRDQRSNIASDVASERAKAEDNYNKSYKAASKIDPSMASDLLIEALNLGTGSTQELTESIKALTETMAPVIEEEKKRKAEELANRAFNKDFDKVSSVNDIHDAEIARERLNDMFLAASKINDLQDASIAEELANEARILKEVRNKEVTARNNFLDTVEEMTSALDTFVDSDIFNNFRNSDAYKGVVTKNSPMLIEESTYQPFVKGTKIVDDSHTVQDREDRKRGAEFYSAGGHVAGTGGPKQDNVAAWLSQGEFVVNAEAAARNRAFLDIINAGGSVPGFAEGTRPDGMISGGIYDAINPEVTRILIETNSHVSTITKLIETQVHNSQAIIRELVDDIDTTIAFELGAPMQDFMMFIESDMAPVLDKLSSTLDVLTKDYKAVKDFSVVDWATPDMFKSTEHTTVSKAAGGHISGPGGPKEDKIPAWLSNGEYVINAASTKKHGALIEAINADTVPAFANGGKAESKYAKFADGAKVNTKALRALSEGRFSKGVSFQHWRPTGQLHGSITGLKGGKEVAGLSYSLSKDLTKITGIGIQAGKGVFSTQLLAEVLKHNPLVKSIDPGELSKQGLKAMGNWRTLAASKGITILPAVNEKTVVTPKGNRVLVSNNPAITDLHNKGNKIFTDVNSGNRQWAGSRDDLPKGNTDWKAGRHSKFNRYDRSKFSNFGSKDIKALRAGTVPSFSQSNLFGNNQGFDQKWLKGTGHQPTLPGMDSKNVYTDKWKKKFISDLAKHGRSSSQLDLFPQNRLPFTGPGISRSSGPSMRANAARFGKSFLKWGLGPAGIGISIAELIDWYMESDEATKSVMDNVINLGPTHGVDPITRKKFNKGGLASDSTLDNWLNFGAGVSGAKAIEFLINSQGAGKGWLPNSMFEKAFGMKGSSSAWWQAGKMPFGLQGSFFGAKPTMGGTLGLAGLAGWGGFELGKMMSPEAAKYWDEEALNGYSRTKGMFGFANGGLASKGRNGDTELAHVNPIEAEILKAMGGSGTINPSTGLREYAQGSKAKAVNIKSKTQEDLLTAVKELSKEQADTLLEQLEYFKNVFDFRKGELNEEEKNWKKFNESEAVKSFESATGVEAKALVQAFGASFEMELGNLFKTGKFDAKSMLSTFATSVSTAFMNKGTALAVAGVEDLGKSMFTSMFGPEEGDALTKLKGEGFKGLNAEVVGDKFGGSKKEGSWWSNIFGEGSKGVVDAAERTGVLPTKGLASKALEASEDDTVMSSLKEKLSGDESIFSDISNWGTKVMDSVSGVFKEDGFLGGIWKSIGDFGGELMDGISGLFSGGEAGGGFGSMFSGITDWFKGMDFGAMFSGAGDWISGLFSGFTFAEGGPADKKFARFATGGMIQGAGGPTEDKIPAWLSDGEYVVNAAATAQYRPILESINAKEYAKGGFAKFAKGGFAKFSEGGINSVEQALLDNASGNTGIKPIPQSKVGNTEVSNNVNVSVNVTNGNASVDVDAGSSNEMDAEQSKALGSMIGQRVQEQLLEEQKPGGILSSY